MDNIFRKFEDAESKWGQIIQNSFLSEKLKASYSMLIDERAKQLFFKKSTLPKVKQINKKH